MNITSISKPSKVAVVGAGLAGLTTAYRLQENGWEVNVYEARNRVGGRVLSIKLNDRIAELGAQTFTNPAQHVNLCRLIHEFNLETTSYADSLKHSYFTGTDLISVDDLLKNSLLKEKISQINLSELSSNTSNMKEVLDKILEPHDPLYKILAIRLAVYEGAPIENLSSKYSEALYHLIKALLNASDTIDEVKSVNRFSIQGGNGRLPKKIAEALGNRVHLNQCLTKVNKLSHNKFRLIFLDGQEVEADVLVLALPCSGYQNIQFEDSIIHPDKLQNIENVPYGTNAKILIPFPYAPTQPKGLINESIFSSFNLSQNVLTMHFTDATCSHATSHNIFSQSRSMLELAFERDFNAIPAYATDDSFATYEGPVAYSWYQDPYAKGSYAYLSNHQENMLTTIVEEKGEKFRALFLPIDSCLYFAGEHTSILEGFLGTMEAACESGERIARAIDKAGTFC